ncbi:MAG: tetratricopeptide repeat protein [Methanosarcinales archaeon]|nr:tetratricopeptide repeat protein [Methanosarcinales archaeon]
MTTATDKQIFEEGVGHLKAGECRQAESAFGRLVREHPQNPNFRRRLGIAYLSQGEYQKARKQFTEALDLVEKRGIPFDLSYDPDETGQSLIALTYHDRGYAFLMENRFSMARKDLQKAIKGTKKPDTLSWFHNDLGWLYFRWEKYDLAEKQYDLVLSDLAPGNGYTFLYRGLARYKKGDYEGAREDYASALEIFEQTAEDLETRFESARIPEVQIARASALINLSRIDLEEDKFGPAEESLLAALEIYEENQGQMEKFSPLRKRQEENNLAALHNNLGLLYYRLQMMDRAREEFRAALEHERSAEVYNNLGNVYAELGQKDRAEKFYRLAARLDPGLQSPRKNLEQLREKGAVGPDWWDWWFRSPPRDREEARSTSRWNAVRRRLPRKVARRLIGSLLVVILLISLTSIVLPTALDVLGGPWEGAVFAGKNTSTVTTEEKLENGTLVSTRTTTRTVENDILGRLGVAAFVLLILILPQVKSFSAGAVSVTMSTESKGAAPRE